MALGRWSNPVQDGAGNLITGLTCRVRREDAVGTPLAVLYQDRAGTVSLPNPFDVDTYCLDHIPAFHAVGGSYSVEVYKSGYDRTERYQAVGTAQEADIDSLLIPGYLFEFETATTSPPSPGCVRANHLDLSLATRLYVSQTNVAGSDLGTLLAGLAGGRLVLTSATAGEQASWSVGLSTDQGAEYELVLTSHAGATALPAGRCGVQPVGAAGADGNDGVLSADEVVLTGSSETLLATHKGKTVLLNRATAMALTSQPAATVGAQWMIVVKNIGAGTVTFNPDGAETVDGAATTDLGSGESCIITCDGTLFRTHLRNTYRPGGTDVALADGGTGTSLTAPGADRLLGWRHGLLASEFISLTGLALSSGVLGLDPATQAELEAGSITTKAVTPGRQQFHPSAAKVWGMTTGAGSPVLSASYNVSSITDFGTGDLTVTINVDFSSANYAPLITTLFTTKLLRVQTIYGQNAGDFHIACESTGGSAADPTAGYAWGAFGDL